MSIFFIDCWGMIMRYEEKTKAQLIKELVETQQQVAKQELLEVQHKHAKEALWLSETRSRALLDATNDMAVLADPDGIIIALNKAMVASLGKDQNEMIGTNMFDLFPPEVVASRKARGDMVVHSGKPVRFEDTRNGRDFDTNLYPIFDEQGKVVQIAVFSRDITEQRQTIQALQTSEIRLSEAQSGARAGVWEWDLVTQDVYFSDELYQVFGLTPQTFETSYDNFLNLVHPDDRETMNKDIEGVLASKGTYEGIYRLIRPDNDEVRFMRSRAKVILDADGNMLRMVGIAQDVTELMQAQEELRLQSEIALNIAEGIHLTQTSDGLIIFANPTLERMFGYDTDEMIGKHVSILNGSSDKPPEETAEEITTELHKNGEWHGEIMSIKKDGTPFVCSASVSTFNHSEYGEVWVSVHTDITERKRMEDDLHRSLEKEKELTKLRSNFVTMASHEFRTPLAIIQASADMLNHYGSRLDDGQRLQRFEKIGTQITHITGLLNDLLAIGNIETDAISFTPLMLDLDQLCREIVTQYQSTVGVGMTHHLTYTRIGICSSILIDKKLMHHILTSLLSNAVKYSPQGGDVRVDLSCDEREVVLRVTDEGIGIPEEELPHLFNLFNQSHNVSAHSGTGLGLAITKRAVELHGGTITVESEVGVGTTFTVHLPQ
jgi:PAS domain S-box-containing protein